MVQFTEAWEPGKWQFTVNDVGSAATTLSVNGLRVGTASGASSGTYTDGSFWHIWPWADSGTTYVPPGEGNPWLPYWDKSHDRWRGAIQRKLMEQLETWERMMANAPSELTAQKEKENVRGLYEIYVVEPESGAHFGPFAIIAKDEVAARIKAFAKANVAGDVEDYDILVRRIGDVRAKKAQPVEVKVVEK